MSIIERHVKDEVKKILKKYGDHIDGFWPVPSGYGESHLDWVGCVNGAFVSIETKRPGKRPTPRQTVRINNVLKAGGIALVIDGTEDTTTYAQLEQILEKLIDN